MEGANHSSRAWQQAWIECSNWHESRPSPGSQTGSAGCRFAGPLQPSRRRTESTYLSDSETAPWWGLITLVHLKPLLNARVGAGGNVLDLHACASEGVLIVAVAVIRVMPWACRREGVGRSRKASSVANEDATPQELTFSRCLRRAGRPGSAVGRVETRRDRASPCACRARPRSADSRCRRQC